MDRFLIDYLPHYMQEYLEMKAIMQAEQPEIDSMWSVTERAFADQYIHDATEYGVSRWEFVLNISPKNTETLDERKFRILTRSNQELPYTLTKLKEVLTALCGADGFTINLQAEHYYIEVKLALGNHNNYQAVQDLLHKMVPANMTQYVTLMYNPNEMFNGFRHVDLAEFTHETIKSEVLNDA